MLSFGVQIQEKKKKEKIFGSDLGKGRRLPIPNIPGGEWENQSTWGKNPFVRCSANPMILIFMRVLLPSKLRKTKQNI